MVPYNVKVIQEIKTSKSINGEFFSTPGRKKSQYLIGYLVGDGVWEGIRLYKGKLAFVNDHLARLWTVQKLLDLIFPIL